MAYIIDSGGGMEVFWGPGAKERFEAALGRKDSASPEDQTARETVGDKMADGTVYAGISPDTGKRMYTTPRDARLMLIFNKGNFTFNKAKDYAAKLDASGHQDWRVPTKGELGVLFTNRAAIGGFNISGSIPAGWYWSSSQLHDYNAWAQRFSDGGQIINYRLNASSLRCVR